MKRNFGIGKIHMLASMLAIAINKNSGPISVEETQDIERTCRHMRSGFTNSISKKKRKNRKRSQIAFESRRRNRR